MSRNLSRRTVLATGAATAGAATTASIVQSSAASAAATSKEEHRVVIVGSGFGGGVAALRLAQAGVPVTVLERGKWWPTGPNADTFPNALKPDKRMLWHGTFPEAVQSLMKLIGKPIDFDPYVGLLEPVLGANMLAMCAAGVGGGSLVYQGMTLQPSEDAFNEVLPEELDYDRMAQVYYPRVAQMLQVAVAPDVLIDSPTYKAPRVFKRRAEAAGYPVEKIPMPIDWDYALAELRGEMKPSYTDGSGALGVNNGGKHSVDVTYVDQAMATGNATVRSLHEVTSVARASDGRWLLRVNRTDESGTVLEQIEITTKALIMAAGSLNTGRLLVEAKGRGDIPSLPDAIGTGWGTNGDRIYVWTDLVDNFGPKQGGPVIYGSKEWDDPAIANTVIQASLPPVPVAAETMTMMVGFGTSPARGDFRYSAASDRATLHWPANGDRVLHRRIAERVHRISGLTGPMIDTFLAVPSTWHPLGGAPMGAVCDLEGRVHDNPGLYVLDGALIPGSTAACNPSMTIAAVAERALDEIVRQDVGTLV